LKTTRPPRRRPRLLLEPLEPRFLLSADFVPLDASLVSDPLPPVPAVFRAMQPVDVAPPISMQLEAAVRELVLVDASLPDGDRLLADLLRATGGERPVEIVYLDPTRDGIEQVSEALASHRGLAAVHVLSHGTPGAVQLGTTTLAAETLGERAATIGGWADAFAADGDLLLYGCDVAATPEGEAFLGGLARLTGADVAASRDLTGDATLGGDWHLEFATGAIEQTMLPLTDALWGGVLAPQTLDWDDVAVDWPAASLGPHSFAVGGGNVTIQVAPNLLPMSTTTINNGSPDDATVDQGGLAVAEQGLYISSSGFQPGESVTITIAFSHPGGVSDVSFTVFDIDRGTFTDEVQATYTASGPVTLTITDSLNNDLVAPDTVRGIAGTPSIGIPDSGNANATFTFTGSGISLITLAYRNAGGVSNQSITLHDIAFDDNDPPTANPDAAIVIEDSGPSAIDVLANDSFAPDVGETLTITAVTQGAGGGVNDAPTLGAPAAIGVVEDVPSPLTGFVFADVDAGANPVTATFNVAQGTLSATAGGGVAVGGTATVLTLTGAIADINAFIAGGSLRYATALDDTAPVALTASLDDLGNIGAGGSLVSPTVNVTLSVTPVNDAPAFGALVLSVDPGGTVVLTSANLSATDVDDAWASLVFFVGNLQNGVFELVGNPGVPVTSFTQGQVAAGAVRFVQTNPFAGPSFVVFVTDGATVVGPGAVAVTFQPAIGVLPPPATGGATEAPPTLSFATTTLGASEGGPGDFSGIRFTRPPLVPVVGGGDAQAAEEARIPTTAGARQAVGAKALGGLVSGRIEFAADHVPTGVPELDFTVRPARHGEEPDGSGLDLDSTRSTGLALSVGVAWWAGRAGGLLSSLLASTPTWRHVDPLPVLGRGRRDEPTGWGEPVAEEERREEASAAEMFRGRGPGPSDSAGVIPR
jgi:hypothetical protein